MVIWKRKNQVPQTFSDEWSRGVIQKSITFSSVQFSSYFSAGATTTFTPAVTSVTEHKATKLLFLKTEEDQSSIVKKL